MTWCDSENFLQIKRFTYLGHKKIFFLCNTIVAKSVEYVKEKGGLFIEDYFDDSTDEQCRCEALIKYLKYVTSVIGTDCCIHLNSLSKVFSSVLL